MQAREIKSYAMAKADSPFNFTLDPATGKLVIPFGVPVGTQLKYVERVRFTDGSYEDSDWKTFTVP